MFGLIVMLLLSEAPMLEFPCEHGGSGAQCVSCTPSDRGTVVCRGLCYYKDPKKPRPDAGYRSEPLKTEKNTEREARAEMPKKAAETCK